MSTPEEKEEIMIYNAEDKIYYFTCPHCFALIDVPVNNINCAIFRHGAYKNIWENGLRKPIDPHTPKEACDKLVETDQIIGCGKPLRFIPGDPPRVEICDYI